MSLLFWRKKKEVMPAVNIPYVQNVASTSPEGLKVINISIRRSLLHNEKKIKRFLSHKITHSRCLDRPDKMAREIYKWLVNNL